MEHVLLFCIQGGYWRDPGSEGRLVDMVGLARVDGEQVEHGEVVMWVAWGCHHPKWSKSRGGRGRKTLQGLLGFQRVQGRVRAGPCSI